MKDFKKTISGIEFNFIAVTEGRDEVFRVSADSQNFKMITDDEGFCGIWQQVPRWVKELEEDLANAIEEQYAQVAAPQPPEVTGASIPSRATGK